MKQIYKEWGISQEELARAFVAFLNDILEAQGVYEA